MCKGIWSQYVQWNFSKSLLAYFYFIALLNPIKFQLSKIQMKVFAENVMLLKCRSIEYRWIIIKGGKIIKFLCESSKKFIRKWQNLRLTFPIKIISIIPKLTYKLEFSSHNSQADTCTNAHVHYCSRRRLVCQEHMLCNAILLLSTS